MLISSHVEYGCSVSVVSKLSNTYLPSCPLAPGRTSYYSEACAFLCEQVEITQVVMDSMTWLHLLVGFILVVGLLAQSPDEGYSREQLLPLTKFRQQHRRTIDGRLCSAAFVQNRKTYSGCTDAPNPDGESGRPWCYVEAQVLEWHQL